MTALNSASAAPVTKPQTIQPMAFRALASLSLSMLMPSLDTSIANAGLPVLARALEGSFQAVQWVVLAYLLAVTALIVSVGRLGDLVGRRRLLLIGIVTFTLASIGCGFAPTLPVLIGARAVQGLGAAMMTALALSLVSDVVPAAKTGRAMGLLGTMSAIGTTLGPSLGGILTAAAGWRSIFLINAPVGILTAVLAFRSLPADRPVRTRHRLVFDARGTGILALTLTSYALAMTWGHGDFGGINLLLSLAAIAGAVAFVLVERKAPSPLVPLAIFRDRALSAGVVTSALVATVMMTTLVVGPFYLSRAVGLPPAALGFVLSIGPLMAALTGVPAGRFVDRWGSRPITIVGLAGMGTGATTISLLPGQFGVAGYVLPLVVMTASYALFQTANNTAIMSTVGAGQRGMISGLLSLSRNLGLISGASLMGAVFALASGTHELKTARASSVAIGMRITFAVAAALIAAAAAVALGAGASSARRANAAIPPGAVLPQESC